MALVVDASIALKCVLDEPDTPLARALIQSGAVLLMPDIWLNESANILWLQVRKGIFMPEEAHAALDLLTAQVPATPTRGMQFHDTALAIGIASGHSAYDSLYVAFALAMGADAVMVAHKLSARDMQRHPDQALAGMLLPLDMWAQGSAGM